MKLVKDLLKNKEVYYVRYDYTIMDTIKYMNDRNIGTIVVFKDDRLVGLFNERDLIKLVEQEVDLKNTQIEEVMRIGFVVSQHNETTVDCLKKMQKLNCRYLPVVEKDEYLGLISMRDLLEIEVENLDAELKQMESYLTYKMHH
jgi:predicted transcriptional regulator